MNDFNFFSDYKVKKVPRTKSSKIVNILFLLTLISIAGYISYNYYVMTNIQNEMGAIDNELMEMKASKDLVRVTKKQDLLKSLSATVAALEAAGKDIELSSLISENLLAVLVDTMPSDVSLTSFAVSDNVLSLSGVAMSKPAIAEYEYNLRNSNLVETIFLNRISSNAEEGALEAPEDERYTFTMNLTIGGESDEN